MFEASTKHQLFYGTCTYLQIITTFCFFLNLFCYFVFSFEVFVANKSSKKI